MHPMVAKSQSNIMYINYLILFIYTCMYIYLCRTGSNMVSTDISVVFIEVQYDNDLASKMFNMQAS